MSRALRPLFVNVTWGAGGSTAAKSLELAETCQRQLGLTTCLHLTCTNMNRSLIDKALSEAKALGIRNILALRGDPQRSEEYRDEDTTPEESRENEEFVWAADLVRYVRKEHNDYFCIGVAGYPEGHADEAVPDIQDLRHDLPYLIEKVKAGADFILTQLFFDVRAFDEYETLLRNHDSGIFKEIPIIPGLMPVQSYSTLKRTTKLSHAKVPPDIEKRLDKFKNDDEAVKRVGVDILCEIVEEIKSKPSPRPRGFHFYTLNLEKAVAFILERCHLIPPSTPNGCVSESAIDMEETDDFLLVPRQADQHGDKLRRQSSVASDPHNRLVVDSASSTSNKDFEAPADEAGFPREKVNTRANTLAISEGEGALGREATWDDYPNGRWGDARSPAYGEIDGYGVSLHMSVSQAIKLWGHPTTREGITEIFVKYVEGTLSAIPWSEEDLREETNVIRYQLLALNKRSWWTVASQPAVNGVRSSDQTFGWGPQGGFVFQKAFVELFLPEQDWFKLRDKLREIEDVSYYAGNCKGELESNDISAVNAVTWGAFPGKE